jgi:AcrR family transcriptional regulator
MVEDDRSVKGRRYDASGRQARSAATRQRVIDAARDHFVRRGYRATTIAAVAADAGVNPDTVYTLVGRKPAILRELIEQAISGTDRAVAAEERPLIAAIRAEPDAVAKLRLYATSMRQTLERLAPLFLAVRDAASTEPDAHQVWHEISERRAANMRNLATDLRATGRLRPDLTIDTAADVVWTTNSPEVWVLLTVERGWSPDRYEVWLADAWCRLLLTDG